MKKANMCLFSISMILISLYSSTHIYSVVNESKDESQQNVQNKEEERDGDKETEFRLSFIDIKEKLMSFIEMPNGTYKSGFFGDDEVFYVLRSKDYVYKQKHGWPTKNSEDKYPIITKYKKIKEFKSNGGPVFVKDAGGPILIKDAKDAKEDNWLILAWPLPDEKVFLAFVGYGRISFDEACRKHYILSISGLALKDLGKFDLKRVNIRDPRNDIHKQEEKSKDTDKEKENDNN